MSRPAKLDTLQGRSVPEWVGSSPDAAIPTRVRLRVFERYGGRCYLTGRLIRPGDDWDLDHIKPLKDGGEHREGNLAPALRDKHREKTAAENRDRAKAARIRARHIGTLPKTKRPIPSRPFPKSRPPIRTEER
jgi:5-methylcytosine-specific restriction endonuclease McrA